MINLDDYKNCTPDYIMEQIRVRSNLIVMMQRDANAGKFKSVNSAIDLQRVQKERQQLWGLLKPPYLAAQTDFCIDEGCPHAGTKHVCKAR